MSILTYHITTAGSTNHCTAQFWVYGLQRCIWIICFSVCSLCSCCTVTSQHWSTCTMTKVVVNKSFYDWISSAISCIMMKAVVNKSFYDWISSAITSQSFESGLICSDSTGIYCYSHVYELRACPFTQALWSWASIISVQSLWCVTLQRWDCLVRWMLFFLLFGWFYQVTSFSFNAILSERSFYHWNFRSQAFSATDQCLQ